MQSSAGPTRLHVRVGTDLVSTEDIDRSIARYGDRYLTRLFSVDELAWGDGRTPRPVDGLAARFAAKEAVLKALQPTFGVGFHDIEITNDTAGAPAVRLGGAMERHARQIGLFDSSLSLSHEGGLASAVFVALLNS